MLPNSQPSVAALRCMMLVWLLTACGARDQLTVPNDSADKGTSSGDAGSQCRLDGEECQSPADCCSNACTQNTCGQPACREGESPVTLATNVVWPYGIVVDSSFVYFTSYDSIGALFRVPKSGGDVEVLVDNLDFPDQLADDARFLYMTVADSGAGQVLRIEKDSFEVTVLASSQFGPAGIDIDDTHVFWANYFGGIIATSPKDQSSVIVLASAEANPFRMAVSGDRVFWSGLLPGLRTVPKTGGTVTTITTGDPRSMVGDQTHVYFTDTSDNTLRRIQADGQNEQILASLEGVGSFPDGLAVDDERVVVSLASGSVVRVPKDGGDPVVLATDQDSPTIVALDRSCVYWTNTGLGTGQPGSVMRAPK